MRLKLNGTRSRGFPTPLTPYDPVFSNLLLRVLRKSLTSFEFAKAAQNENRQKRRLNILNLLAKNCCRGMAEASLSLFVHGEKIVLVFHTVTKIKYT